MFLSHHDSVVPGTLLLSQEGSCLEAGGHHSPHNHCSIPDPSSEHGGWWHVLSCCPECCLFIYLLTYSCIYLFIYLFIHSFIFMMLLVDIQSVKMPHQQFDKIRFLVTRLNLRWLWRNWQVRQNIESCVSISYEHSQEIDITFAASLCERRYCRQRRLSVCVCVCVSATTARASLPAAPWLPARRISLGGEGHALYPVL